MSVPLRQQVLPRPVAGTPPRPRPPSPERWTLSNGLRVVAVPRRSLPQVALRVVLPAGSATDAPGAGGLASLVGSLLAEGTATRSGEELNRKLDRLGASLSVQVGHDFAEVDLLVLSETLPEGVELLGEILAQPSFPGEELDRVRAETAEALESRLDEPANVADDALSEAIFPDAHPYGRLPLGTIESVLELDRGAVVAHHERYFRPAGAVLLAAGDFDPERLAALLESRLADWEGTADRPRYPEDLVIPPSAGQRLQVPWPDAQQAEIRIGGRGMERSSDDWVAGSLANYLIGGSTITGRLGANLREDKGWTYGVRSGFSASIRAGGWAVETAVDADMAEAALDEVIAELTRFLAEPVPEEELRRGKDALILSLPRAFETPGRIVARMATVEVFALPPDYWETFPDRVEALGREDLLRIGHTYFDPSRLVAISVGAGA